MAKFLTNAGIIIETNDRDKIECFKAKGLEEYKPEPQPVQEVEATDDYVVKPAKKKASKKGG